MKQVKVELSLTPKQDITEAKEKRNYGRRKIILQLKIERS